MIRALDDSTEIIRYRLLSSGKVQQQFAEDQTTIDPDLQMRQFNHRRNHTTVRAVQIPNRFLVGADLCTDGYLVLSDTGLHAVSTQTFQKDYEPAMQLGDAA